MNKQNTQQQVPKETLDELKALVREKCPNAQGSSVEELLAALIPTVPEEIAENQAAVEAVHSALQAAASATKR